MRILHAAALLRPPSGILHQMQWEQDAARELAVDWAVRVFCPAGAVPSSEIIEESPYASGRAGKGIVGKLIDWVMLRWLYFRWLKSQESTVDVFLLRYYVHDPFQLVFVIFCKKPVYFVHHTMVGYELAMPGRWRDKVRLALDQILAGVTIRAASGIVGVTDEIICYERQRASQPSKTAFLYPNGIASSAFLPALDLRDNTPEIIFVASYFMPWHGLDLLLKSMITDDTPCVLHLVGSMSEGDLAMAEKDSRIVVHGVKRKKEIADIAGRCWGGLSSFALNRNNMSEACTLKVREYLALGLPVYAGYREMLPENFPFYSSGRPDLPEIMRFFLSVRHASRQEVAGKSMKIISKKRYLSDLYENITSTHN
ncbi:MAG: glycosyltransferase involved in cell wall biosynthesis [Neolewinella sp.]|jgi:glycosyltransferase involved in cell wall biosynthesis